MNKKSRTVFRPLDGLLLLDKPAGLSSNQALQRARHLLRAEKAGHTGSLDPLATGVLPLCFGEATKIAGLLLGSGKAYEAVAALGTTTDTDDAEGVPLRERPVPALTDAAIERALASFRGPIAQRAPIYSALKQGGEPLYARARRGEPVEAPVRTVRIDALRVMDRQPAQLRLHIECGSGTYIRSLVRDLGEALGCGAHVLALRRLWVDPFREPRLWTLEALQQRMDEGGEAALDGCLLPIEDGLGHFPRVALPSEAAVRFGHGQVVEATGPAGPVAVFHVGGRILGLGWQEGGRLRPQRLFRWAAGAPAVPGGC